MDPNSQSAEEVVTIRVSHIDHSQPLPPPVSNPWAEDVPETGLHTPDLPALDPSMAPSFFSPPEHHQGDSDPQGDSQVVDSERLQAVLKEFDPLGDPMERDARDAWGTSESHPPPPDPVAKDEVPQASSSFPSLASLARSFAIPSLARSRPASMEIAKLVQDDGPDAPFDFQRFVEQMKLKAAEPVAKYLRSFLSNFAKRTFTVKDQVRIIHDFLDFISLRMRESDVWKHASNAEFDNAMEGMEKLVMNRLYDFVFTPMLVKAIPPRPITSDDLERDRVLSQRIALFGWIEEKHLDVPVGEGSKGFLLFAQQELLKINHYKAPRDKLICILNCCKVIFGLIRHLHREEGADSFVPILIFVVLKANPGHLLSNVEFINRFRNPAKLTSETGYYLSSLMGAVSFIETMDHTSVSNITQQEFEKNVEEAIQSLPDIQESSPRITTAAPPRSSSLHQQRHAVSPLAGEESASPLSLPTPTITDDARRLLQRTGDTISKPLNAIGRIFSEALDGAEEKLTYLPGPFAPFEIGRERRAEESAAADAAQNPRSSHPEQPDTSVPSTPSNGRGPVYTTTSYRPRVRKIPPPLEGFPGAVGSSGLSPEFLAARPGSSAYSPLYFASPPSSQPGTASMQGISRTPTPAVDLAAIQAQIDTAHQEAANEAMQTLLQMFPVVEKEVVQMVLEANEGDMGKSIEGLLEMSSQG